MTIRTQLVTTLFAFAALPLCAQQQSPASPPMQSQSASSEASTATAAMTPINGELVSTLDSKTAKAGDSVVVQTRASAKTPEGTEIPKGSKLVGHVIGAQPSADGKTSQVALLLDHVELTGGQTLPIHSQIQSITPAGGAVSDSAPAAMSAPPAAGSSNPAGASQGPASAPQAASGAPPAGTVVAKTGNIDIRTTSVPGVLLANNAPGQQDPRMTHASSILLGAKQDIQLTTGTQMVVGVAATSGGTQ
jgi:hypothetical protein